MVVTIEPGIYFIDMLLEELRQGAHADAVAWARVDAFRPYGGIRTEDDVLVTKDGSRMITAKLARSADEIEAFMAA
jgi:Xaa-Pro dipeptidase